MAEASKASVIVVGGSLVGLSTALFLAHWNVPVILLERHRGSSLHPRAIGYTARTMELLRSVGMSNLAEAPGAMTGGGPPRRVTVESLAGKWQHEQDWTQRTKPEGKPQGGGSPFKAYSPVDGIAIAQDKIEPHLRARAIELGANLRLGQKVIDWAQDDAGVNVTTVDKDGKESHIKGQYLVACDGSRSPIREKLGIQRHGVGHIRALRSILFRCPRIEEYLNTGFHQFQIQGRDDGFEAFMTTYGDGRWMIAWHETGETTSSDGNLDDSTQLDYICKATGLDLADEDITRITTGKWGIDGLIADSFSSGRVFLAGDAAHSLPPNRGGYGANTGIADAHNIAWKLAAVLGGHSRPELLQTYDAERRPVAQVRHDQVFARDDYRRFVHDMEWAGKNTEILDDVSMEFGQLYHSGSIVGADDNLPLAQTPEQWKGQPGVRAPHVALRRGEETLSTLDFFGQSWVVISKDQSWEALASSAAEATHTKVVFALVGGETVEDKAGEFEKLFGLESGGAALVRPDGVIAWRVSRKPDDAESALTGALNQASYAKA